MIRYVNHSGIVLFISYALQENEPFLVPSVGQTVMVIGQPYEVEAVECSWDDVTIRLMFV